MSKPTVVVLGAGGAQASGVLRGLGRSSTPMRIVSCDREFRDGRVVTAGAQEVTQVEFDLMASPDQLYDLLQSADLVVNCTGPYYTLGPMILDAAIAAGTDYLDICDDADATDLLLRRDEAARAAGVTALVGMGSAPGTTNVLVRLALDALPAGDASVAISWCVDASDMVGAVVPHFAHSFATAIPDAGGTPSWEALGPKRVRFPDPVGEQMVVTLSHPEVLTLPRFTRVTEATNQGGLIPEDFTHLGWVISRLPEGDARTAAMHSMFETARVSHGDREPVGSGLIVDVRVGDEGIVFVSGGKMSQDDATGTPAAAGCLIALTGQVPGPGVVCPEVLRPADFFSALRDVSAGGGGMTAFRTNGGEVTESVRIRDLLEQAQAVAG
ncbi:saccharopine dehydrogenase family protein [Nocardioides pocheonensis]|uniref:Saccharopine dehydrogenase n=1 Tax=Nocardioides pocheonensis TaxID=661485 RepID=A0A3N0GH64_9ACTN|nr:saccharopine dehydrogenase NADP-binding domain-containing protein [Nocardioides pocheonensis]RNM11804.1 saccharopine dehydrogenase [Nocardioides pocheonensis]